MRWSYNHVRKARRTVKKGASMAMGMAQAAALADMLPDDLRCDDARQRLLCVCEILTPLTDEAHVLSNADIRSILRARFGDMCAPSENTIAADLRAIASAGCLGVALHMTPSGCWCERLDLSPAKVRLMINAVQSSRFLTTEQSTELQEDIFSLVSRHQEDDLATQVLVDQRVRKSYQQVFDALDVIARAMNTGRKIKFAYTYSDFAGKPRAIAADDGSLTRVETPIALYFSENNYYVETYTDTPWRHGSKRMVSRVDRMIDVRVSSQVADRSRASYDLRRSARRRMTQSFDMISGTSRRIFLRVRSDATNQLFDRFGFGLRFGQFEGTPGEPSATGLTLVQVPQTFTFFRWLSSAGAGIVMVEPPSELGLRAGPWKRALQDVSREELVEDHAQMVQGFLAYLDRARAPYTP